MLYEVITTHMIETLLKNLFSDAIKALGLSAPEINLERPKDEAHGDYAVTTALTIYKTLSPEEKSKYQNPINFAQAIVDSAPSLPPEIKTISVAPPGFINITRNNFV